MSGYSDEELSVITEFLTRAASITAEQVARLRDEAKDATVMNAESRTDN